MLRLCLALSLAGMLLPATATAATYRGHSIDGRRYGASLKNDDIGTVVGVEVKFSGRDATVYVRGTSQLYLVLDEEEITDPRHIAAHDDKRGIEWEIDVRNLREAAEGAR